MEPIVAGIISSVLTLFDLDRTFYIPQRVQSKITLYLWWWGFIVINGVLAGLLYTSVGNMESLKTYPSLLRAGAVGIGYLTIVRLKFTTFNIRGTDVPAGFELFYEAAKNFAYKRINIIAKVARSDETIEMANHYTLEQLTNRAKLSIKQDQLLKLEDKGRLLQW